MPRRQLKKYRNAVWLGSHPRSPTLSPSLLHAQTHFKHAFTCASINYNLPTLLMCLVLFLNILAPTSSINLHLTNPSDQDKITIF